MVRFLIVVQIQSGVRANMTSCGFLNDFFFSLALYNTAPLRKYSFTLILPAMSVQHSASEIAAEQVSCSNFMPLISFFILLGITSSPGKRFSQKLKPDTQEILGKKKKAEKNDQL